MQVLYLVGSSMVYLTLDRRCSPLFGSKLFTDCSLSLTSTCAQRTESAAAPIWATDGLLQA